MDSKTARIRALNDELRQNFAGGAAVMTPGIAALGADAVARLVKTVAAFDDFCHANVPMQTNEANMLTKSLLPFQFFVALSIGAIPTNSIAQSDSGAEKVAGKIVCSAWSGDTSSHNFIGL